MENKAIHSIYFLWILHTGIRNEQTKYKLRVYEKNFNDNLLHVVKAIYIDIHK